MTDDISTAEIEEIEAESYAEFETAASPEAQAALGTRLLRIGGGLALAMPNDTTGFWSKAVGLGFTDPVTAELAERIAEFYQEQGMSSALVQLAPEALPADWSDICAKANISDSGSHWNKLVGDLATMTEVTASRGGASGYLGAGLRVGRVSTQRAREWGSVMWEVFGFPFGDQLAMPIGVVGKPHWQAFAVFEGEEIVAVGALHTHGRVGHLFGGATLPRARGGGAQSALIAARARAAREAGCEWLVAETPGEGPGERNSSLHNLLRAGMSVRYRRQNWIWIADVRMTRKPGGWQTGKLTRHDPPKC